MFNDNKEEDPDPQLPTFGKKNNRLKAIVTVKLEAVKILICLFGFNFTVTVVTSMELEPEISHFLPLPHHSKPNH